MKTVTLIFVLFFCWNFSSYAQNSDPVNSNLTPLIDPIVEGNPLFDLLFINNIGSSGSTGSGPLTGVLFLNGEYWFSEWNSNVIHAVDVDNNLLGQFTIPGITGARTFSSDGTNVFVGTAEDKIYVVDHASRTLIQTITETSNAVARMVAYDESLDNGNGGFWIGGFDNNLIASIDMNGNELSQIDGSRHLTVPYGGVVDNISEGGPYLWVHEFGFGCGLCDFVTRIDLSTGMQTGHKYNFASDAPAGTSNIQAGGIFLSNEVDPDGPALLGLCQCAPSNLLFALRLDEPLSVNTEEALELSIYPNPVDSNVVFIRSPFQGIKEVNIFSMLGELVINKRIDGDQLELSSIAPGLYFIEVNFEGRRYTQKLVVN